MAMPAGMPAVVSDAAHAFVASLNGRRDLLHAQSSIGLDVGPLQTGQVNALLVELGTASFTTADATYATKAINAEPWSHAQRISLSSAISEAALRHTGKGSAHKAKRDLQDCAAVDGAFTAADWSVFTDPNLTIDPKCETAGTRMYRVGMICPSYELLTQAGSVVVAAHGQHLSPDDKRKVCVAIKDRIKYLDKRNRDPFPHQVLFSSDFANMDEARRVFAYGEEAPTTTPGTVNLSTTAGLVHYKRSHRSLQHLRDPTPSGAMGGHSSALMNVQDATSNPMLMQMQQMLQPLVAAITTMVRPAAPPCGTAGGIGLVYPGQPGYVAQQFPGVPPPTPQPAQPRPPQPRPPSPFVAGTSAFGPHTPPAVGSHPLEDGCMHPGQAAVVPPTGAVKQEEVASPPHSQWGAAAVGAGGGPGDDGVDAVAEMEAAMRANAAALAKSAAIAKAKAVAKAPKGGKGGKGSWQRCVCGG